MRRIVTFLLMLLAGVTVGARGWEPADPDATSQAKELFQRLLTLQKKGIMYGHQDDLLTGRTWINEKGRSSAPDS